MKEKCKIQIFGKKMDAIFHWHRPNEKYSPWSIDEIKCESHLLDALFRALTRKWLVDYTIYIKSGKLSGQGYIDQVTKHEDNSVDFSITGVYELTIE